MGQDSRFELAAPLNLPAVYVHHNLANVGVGQSVSRAKEVQARILWVDGTANISRMNSAEKISALVEKAASVGFNTLVFDVKPIVGYTLYPSKISEQLGEWRGEKMPAGFDPLRVFVDECHRRGIGLLVSLNAFSEGHSYSKRDFGKADNQFFKPGWGYEHPELQTVRYVPSPTWRGFDVHPTLNPAQWSTPIAAFNKIPSAENVGAYVVVDSYGKVVSRSVEKPTTVAADQTVFAARVEAASALLSVGERWVMDTRAEFRAMGESQNQIPLMMNPHDQRVQERALSFVNEICSQYEIDGLLYDDRLRFGGLDTDFSPATMAQFEGVVGKKLQWPDDVFRYTFSPRLDAGILPGRFFDDWLAFRSAVMAAWVKRVNQTVKKQRPNAMVGVYAGSWYGDYQKYGSNYASTELNAGFPFLTRAYKQTGFANWLDLLVTGCYYPYGTVYEAAQSGAVPGRTVEAAGILSNRVARDRSWVVAGVQLSNFWDDPMRLEPALQAAASTTQGVMVFDLSHRMEQFWPAFERAFKTKRQAPYQVPGLLELVRKRRDLFDKQGFKDPPFPMFEGAPGTGF